MAKPRLPSIGSRIRVGVTEPSPAGERVASRQRGSLRSRVSRELKRIAARYAKAESEFYEIGKELHALQSPEVYRAMGVASFDALIRGTGMSPSTGRRFVVVAKTYSRKTAAAMGMERAFQLQRLARVHPKVRRSPEQLWLQNPKLGGKRVRDMSAEDMKMMVLKHLPRKPAPKVSGAQEAALDRFVDRWEQALGLEADFEIDAKAGVVRIEVSLDELLKK